MSYRIKTSSQWRWRCLAYALSLWFAWQLGMSAFAVASDPPGIRYGRFEVTYTPAQLLDPATVDSVSEVIGADDEITWKMYVPETYDANRPAGLMVYISPTPDGRIPGKWKAVVDEENLIWIGANRSGNSTHTAKRILYAVLGPQIAAIDYQIDTDRIYLSGFSGGGKVAGMVSIEFANLFRGAIYICGAEHWTNHPPAYFQYVKANRYVFLSGTDDFNLDLTYEIYRKYQAAGLRNIELIIIPRMRHGTPNTVNFRKAINYLDERE